MKLALLLAGVFVVAANSAWLNGQVRDGAGTSTAIGTAIVEGTVVTAGDQPQPVRRVSVSITGATLRGSRQTTTDDRGHFAFRALPAGAYSIEAAKSGWLTSYLGSRRASVRPYSDVPLQLDAGEHKTDVVLTLQHGSAITGTIRDENGRPIDASVFSVQPRVRDGVRVFTQPSGLEQSTATSDDRGVYRLYGLPPGEYLVAAWRGFSSLPLHAGSDDGRAVNYARVYYPGTTDVYAAGVITLGPNEERAGVDITVHTLPAAAIGGKVLLPNGMPAPNAQLQLLYRTAKSDEAVGSTSSSTFNMATLNSTGAFSGAEMRPDGTFRFASMSPQTYTVVARAADPAAVGAEPVQTGRGAAAGPMLWAAQEISTNGEDVLGLTLVLRPGISLSGRATAPAGVDVSKFVMQLVPSSYAGFAAAPSPVAADGTFRMAGIGPGVYRLRLMELAQGAVGARGGTVPSERAGAITIAGRDVADLPFEVRPGDDDISNVVATIVGGAGEVSGTLRDPQDRPAGDYVIVLFSADRAYWTSANRRMPPPSLTGRNGAYRFGNLPPGDYFLVATSDVDPEALRDPATYEQLAPLAQRLTLGSGEKKVQDFRVR